MKKTPKLLATLALCSITSLSFAAAAPKGTTDHSAASALGIITPDVATSTIVVDYFTTFKDTGEFAICSDGKLNTGVCESKKYLTPSQFVAKFYPKAQYVGYRLLMSSTNSSDTYLYIYMLVKPPAATQAWP